MELRIVTVVHARCRTRRGHPLPKPVGIDFSRRNNNAVGTDLIGVSKGDWFATIHRESAMRFIVGNLEQSRSKAKFLQKCLERFDVQRSLTQCQGYLASSFGFNSWAEMKAICVKSSKDGGRVVDIHQFQRMTSSDFDIKSIGNLHAYSIFARMGYCQSVHHFDFKFSGFYKEFIRPSEAAVALEMIFERYLEIKPRSPEADALISMAETIIAPYADVNPAAFALNGMVFIDQMKTLRIPGIFDDANQHARNLDQDLGYQVPPAGVYAFEGETRDEQHLNAIAFMRQSKATTRYCLPLRWLVDRGGRHSEGVVFYLPALTDGGRALITEFSYSHRILVVENAPDNAPHISTEWTKASVDQSLSYCANLQT
jgi:hypothetical protein